MDYNKKNVEDIDVTGEKVIVRCDFMTNASWLRCRPFSTCLSTRLL